MKLWIDDERPMPRDYDIHVKTVDEAISHLKTHKVTMISFDHDLGLKNGTGYDIAKFIEEEAYYGKIAPLAWTIHSANPVGRSNIEQAMKKADIYWIKNGLI